MTTASCQLQHKSQLTGEACENLNKRRRKLSQSPKVMDYPYNYLCRLCALEWAILSKICHSFCVCVRVWPVGVCAWVVCGWVCVRLCFWGKYCCWPKAVFIFKCVSFFVYFFAGLFVFWRASDFALTVFYSLFFAFV